ncbi:hypothetical protein CFAM422_001612 [Trichoderma lentiforme]|uniref:Uncharacterized protein n=1 Tax=Trichoderma lentiforme TaxID=1567552 RepID=A0A9P4XNL7_9HYPO|nr:hypothetical protein CFAM422_001612 [Trichoderma lentiforme]
MNEKWTNSSRGAYVVGRVNLLLLPEAANEGDFLGHWASTYYEDVRTDTGQAGGEEHQSNAETTADGGSSEATIDLLANWKTLYIRAKELNSGCNVEQTGSLENFAIFRSKFSDVMGFEGISPSHLSITPLPLQSHARFDTSL